MAKQHTADARIHEWLRCTEACTADIHKKMGITTAHDKGRL